MQTSHERKCCWLFAIRFDFIALDLSVAASRPQQYLEALRSTRFKRSNLFFVSFCIRVNEHVITAWCLFCSTYTCIHSVLLLFLKIFTFTFYAFAVVGVQRNPFTCCWCRRTPARTLLLLPNWDWMDETWFIEWAKPIFVCSSLFDDEILSSSFTCRRQSVCCWRCTLD